MNSLQEIDIVFEMQYTYFVRPVCFRLMATINKYYIPLKNEYFCGLQALWMIHVIGKMSLIGISHNCAGSQDPGGPRIWEDNSFSFPSHPLHNYSVPNLPPTPPLHLTLTTRETFFITKCCCRLIFKPSFLLLLISFTLFTLPIASCLTFFL